jgi:hypothetical protein
VEFSLLDIAVSNARALLSSDAKYKLSDIHVEEVSIVDKPANQHTFLVVKRDSSNNAKIGYDSNSKESLDKLLPSPQNKVKANKKSEDKHMSKLIDNIAKSLAQLTEFAKAVKDATKEDGTVDLSDELRKELSSISSEMSKVFVAHGMAKASDTVLQTVEGLVQISELSMLIAEDIAVSGEISDEVTSQMTKISSLLGSITKSDAEPEPAPAVEPEPEPAPAADPTPAVEPAPAAATSSEPSINEALIAQMSRLTTSIDGMVAAQAKSAEPALAAAPTADDENKAIQKQIDDLKAENASMATKLKKAIEEPPARGSSGRSVRKGTDDKPKLTVFPIEYNHEIHDPGATAS